MKVSREESAKTRHFSSENTGKGITTMRWSSRSLRNSVCGGHFSDRVI